MWSCEGGVEAQSKASALENLVAQLESRHLGPDHIFALVEHEQAVVTEAKV